MSDTAAIFDLDRTLVVGATGPILGSVLREHGVLADRSIPGEGVVYRLFDLIGETRPSMLLTRQAARAAAGWDREAVREAGRVAAERLMSVVAPYARQTIEGHRAAGDRLVMATTTPLDLVEPLAERLGFDAVVATRYRAVDGRYVGEIDGPFVWGKGKLAAVSEWAGISGVDLRSSHAYSDSFYDVPLLSEVGHPTAVNPDARLAAYARVRRWPVRRFDAPPGVPKIAGIEPQQVALSVVRPELLPWVRLDVEGTESLPEAGPAIVAANHRSYFDPVAIALALGRRGRPLRFLGKAEVFDAPVVGQLARSLGAIRVDRGSGSDEPLREAAAALEAGEVVAILPQGTIPRGRAFFDPVLRGRWGAARLAEMTGAPVVPLGLWGTEQVWPRSSKVPHLWNVTSPPTVRIRVGEPLVLDEPDPTAATDRIMGAIVDLLPDEARVAREPTAEELARTWPSGRPGNEDGPRA